MKTKKVKDILWQLFNLLESHRVKYAIVIKEIITQLENVSDDKQLPEQIEQNIYNLFGGMGSLNDVWISKTSGHVVENEKEANQHLDELTTALWDTINEK